ncbi:MAG TPA: glutamate--tRNA ligase [Candidatus Polarisedimenticolaceae bacterium]|nr:glutamate--tRNA ligase [Candidatus Polarisedimenticolaceae bacterium]
MRVRFAPSPTGFLHVGGARTAIFNWLTARRHGGTFVLRIEDTDLERSSEPMVQAIVDGLSWLGLAADEGPFFQSRAREQHAADAGRLLAAGHAYRCFCSPQAIQAEREAAERAGKSYIYPRTCRELSAGESAARAGEPHAVRFRVPLAGAVSWEDLVHGPTSFPAEVLEDFVILRSDGTPTYMLSVVSDDVAMRITHVIRGDDHLSNTPKQLLLYAALGHPLPIFAHLPLILGEDKKRLSKRHGAVSVLEYRDRGYLPEAMFNFLALLGWSPGDDRQKLDRDTLVREFDLAGVGKSGAVFDLKKLDWLNGEYLRETPTETLAAWLRPRLEAAGSWRADLPEAWFLRTLELLKPRAKTLEDLVAALAPFLDDTAPSAYDPAAARQHLSEEGVREMLEALASCLERVEPWRPAELEASLRGLAAERGIAAGKLIHPTRLALTGQASSPGIFDVLELVGRERSLERLRRLIARLDSLC